MTLRLTLSEVAALEIESYSNLHLMQSHLVSDDISHGRTLTSKYTPRSSIVCQKLACNINKESKHCGDLRSEKYWRANTHLQLCLMDAVADVGKRRASREMAQLIIFRKLLLTHRTTPNPDYFSEET